jgi:hypothetical protein
LPVAEVEAITPQDSAHELDCKKTKSMHLSLRLTFIALGVFWFAVVPGSGQMLTVSFQHGVNGYSGTEATHISKNFPDRQFGGAPTIFVQQGSSEYQGLLRFEGMLGTAAGQIPPEATILSARLVLHTSTSSTNAISIHRMLIPWESSSTWNSFDHGVDPSAGEAVVTPEITFVPSNPSGTPVELDVTGSVRAWKDGDPNHGWVFLSSGGNRYSFYSLAMVVSDLRPLLQIECYIPTPIEIFAHPASRQVRMGEPATFQVGFSGSSPSSIQWHLNGQPVSGATNAALHIPQVGFEHEGSYFVTISNYLGLATSAEAQLTVLPQKPVRIFDSIRDRMVEEGSTVMFSVTTAGTDPQYQWFKDGVPIPAATNSSVLLTAIRAEQEGVYTLTVTNQVSSESTSGRLLVVPALPPQHEIIPLHHTWKFDQSGQNLGTAWKEPGYDDSAWPSGEGVLAEENQVMVNPLIRTRLSLTNSAGQPIITHYFRTRFILTNPPVQMSLVASNLIDDGAVFYLNGTEFHRYLMPNGPIGHLTLASSAGPEGVFTRASIRADLLVEGENTLAVEVHQVNEFSSDVVFGMILLNERPPPSPLSIHRQPKPVVIEESRPLTLRVEVMGNGALYRWYKNSVPIPGANADVFNIPKAALADGGNYHVMVGNGGNLLSSAIASVTVILDTTPPRILSSVRSGPDQIDLEFSEEVQTLSASETANYSLQVAGTAQAVEVFAAMMLGPNTVRLITAPLDPAANYVLAVANLRDISLRENLIEPGVQVMVGIRQRIFSYETPWVFWSFDTDPGAGWFQPDYDDSEWPGAPGDLASYAPFAHSPNDFQGGGMRTSLSLGTGRTTFYFRKLFDLPGSSLGSKLFLRHILRDGAVVYLNGTEVHRIGMPPGLIQHYTLANRDAGTWPVEEGPFELPGNLLKQENNLLAVEVHLQSGRSRHVAFAAELESVADSVPEGPVVSFSPAAEILVGESYPLTLTRAASGAKTFQWLRNSEPIPGATQPFYTFHPSLLDDGAAYSLALANDDSNAVTPAITLRVEPDTVPPRLISAVFTNQQVLVTFSESVSAETAQDISNYVMHDGQGTSWEVLSAAQISPNSVLLTMGSMPLSPGGFFLQAQRIRDVSARGNQISSWRGVTLGISGPLLEMSRQWKWTSSVYDPFGIDPEPGWMQPQFDDAMWAQGRGIFDWFWAEDRAGVGGQPVNTWLPQTNSTGDTNASYQFRAWIDLPKNPQNLSFMGRLLTDDGAIIYVNGHEVHRTRMPWGPVTKSTFASNTLGTATPSDFFPSSSRFVTGPNLIAVSIHKRSISDGGVTFGLEISSNLSSQSVLMPRLEPPPELRFLRTSNGLILSWDGEGYRLEQSRSMAPGSWRPVIDWTREGGARSPQAISPAEAVLFFRLIEYLTP